jgi:hypothetical protein
MSSMIRGLEAWTEETHEFNREYGKLKMRAGIGIIDALENWYFQWKETKSRRARDEYMKWRVRLHRKWNFEPEFLERLDEVFSIGLYDGTIGKTLWDIPAEEKVNLSTGYNWRRDSGHALRGGQLRKEDAQDLV